MKHAVKAIKMMYCFIDDALGSVRVICCDRHHIMNYNWAVITGASESSSTLNYVAYNNALYVVGAVSGL